MDEVLVLADMDICVYVVLSTSVTSEEWRGCAHDADRHYVLDVLRCSS